MTWILSLHCMVNTAFLGLEREAAKSLGIDLGLLQRGDGDRKEKQ